jgi:hypothetical protein
MGHGITEGGPEAEAGHGVVPCADILKLTIPVCLILLFLTLDIVSKMEM